FDVGCGIEPTRASSASPPRQRTGEADPDGPGRESMDIAFCHENVLPARGGCETYIAALARRLGADGHQGHLYACACDAEALPPDLHYPPVRLPPVPRFLRPWWFSRACRRALRAASHRVSIGFDKAWGLDVLYPQGGLHAASAAHNLLKYPHPV